LNLEEREEIALGVAAKESVRVIAGRLGLASDSMISSSGKSCSTT
jgi:Helix-turn-helix domain